MAETHPEDPSAPHRPLPPRMQRHLAFGLRGRLMVLVLITLLPAFFVVLYTGHTERQAALAEAKRHALELSIRASQAQARLVSYSHTLLSVLARIPQVSQATGTCPSLLRRFLEKQPRLTNLGVFDSHGHLICNAAYPRRTNIDASNRDYFQRVRAHHAFALGDYEIGRITGKPVLVAAYPVLDAKTGQLKAVLFAALRVRWLQTVAAKADLPKGSVFMLLDRRGQMLVRYPGDKSHAGQVPTQYDKLTHSGSQRLIQSPMRFDGKNWLVTYAVLRDGARASSLHVLVSIPAARALARANRTMYRNLAVLSGLGLLSLLLAWLSGSLLVLRPVRRLVLAANSIAGGDLSTRTGITHGPYEFRTLGRAFDEMAATLEQRRRQGKAQERRIARLHRIQQVLSAINGAIVRIRDRDELLQEACRIAVDLGDFNFAWVGLLEEDSDSVRFIAHAGIAQEFAETVRVTIDPDDPAGRGLVGTSIRTNTRTFSNAAQSDPRLEARREDFKKLEVQSVAAFPLRIEQQAVGALVLHTSEPDFFDERELALLDQLAADTSLGMEHIEKARQLDYLAYWDPLTNLPNQRLLEDRLEQSLQRAKRLGTQVVVLAVGIGEFDFVNDTKGRAIGDRLLQGVAQRLASAVRESESLSQLGKHAAKLSGQEFGLVLDDIVDLASIGIVAKRITAALAEPIHLDTEDYTVTVRLAATVFPRDGNDAQELLHKVLFALHNQTQAEHGQLAYYSLEQDTAAQQRFIMEAALRCAVDRDEFYLEYQPRVDARTGQMIGAEALLRWNRPDHGPVPPDQFIPALERMGLIETVGAWVAHTAFAQRLTWRDSVPESFVLSINASACELRDTEYVARMRELVETTRMPPGWVEIEITESGLVESGLNVIDTFASLKALGLRLSVDDFGTGYSSLSYLHQFPVDTLKIDKSFVRDMERDQAALSIVRTVIGLASALELTVVAEGVETEQQLELLAREGCHEIQGYYFSRPLAAEKLEALARAASPFPVP